MEGIKPIKVTVFYIRIHSVPKYIIYLDFSKNLCENLTISLHIFGNCTLYVDIIIILIITVRKFIKNLNGYQLPWFNWTVRVMLNRGGSRGRVQGVRTPPLWDDLRFSNTTGFLPKKKLCGLLVLTSSKRRVHPLLKKILDPPLLK